MRIGTSASFSCQGFTLSLERLNLIGPGLGIQAYRVKPGQPSAIPGIAGYPLQGATPFDPYWFWDCRLNLSESQFQIFNEILIQSQNNGPVILSDARQSIIEDAPRTRALATGTTEIADPPSLTVQYFAQYQILLNTPEDYWKFGGKDRNGVRYRLVAFTATELEKVSA